MRAAHLTAICRQFVERGRSGTWGQASAAIRLGIGQFIMSELAAEVGSEAKPVQAKACPLAKPPKPA
jgi:hypothetical protein